MSTGGEVANALVCKTSIRRFNSGPVLQNYRFRGSDRSRWAGSTQEVSAWTESYPQWSGRTMARTGLRMMPTFPSSPLKFRTAGFPRYGFKAGVSAGAFPRAASTCHVLSVCILPSCPPLPAFRSCFLRSVSEHAVRTGTTMRAAMPLYPRGPRSGPGSSVPIHQHLCGPIRPTRRHSAISLLRSLYALSSLCVAA